MLQNRAFDLEVTNLKLFQAPVARGRLVNIVKEVILVPLISVIAVRSMIAV